MVRLHELNFHQTREKSVRNSLNLVKLGENGKSRLAF